MNDELVFNDRNVFHILVFLHLDCACYRCWQITEDGSMTAFQAIIISLFFIGLAAVSEAVILAYTMIEAKSLRDLARKVERRSL